MSDFPTPTADQALIFAGAAGPQETTEEPFRIATAGDQGDVQAVELGGGRVLLAYTNGGNVEIMTLEANGTPEGAPIPVGIGSAPALAVLADGRVVITWTQVNGGNYDVVGATILPGPPGVPFLTFLPLIVASAVAPSGAPSPTPDVTALADGGFAVTWVDGAATEGTTDIMARVFGGNGFGGPAFAVTSTGDPDGPVPGGEQNELHPVIEGRPEGGFVVAWEKVTGGTFPGVNDTVALEARLYDADGQAVSGSDFSFEDGLRAGFDRSPDLVVLPNNQYVAVWTAGTGGLNDIVAQRFNSDGTAAGDPVTVVGDSLDGKNFSEFTPTIALLSDGGFAVSWLRPSVSPAVVYTRTLNADLTPRGPQTALTIDGNNPLINHDSARVIAMDDGRMLVSWIEPTPISGSPPAGAMAADIRYQFLDPGTGSPFRAHEEQIVTLPTDVRLFDTDGSEVLQQVRIQNLFDGFDLRGQFVDPNDTSQVLGELDDDFSLFLPGGNQNFTEAAWVIDRRQGAAEAAFLDALAARDTKLTLELFPGTIGSLSLFITAASREGNDPNAGFSDLAWDVNVPILIEGTATPTLKADDTLAYTEGDTPTVISGALDLQDADGTLAGAKVQIFTNFQAGQDVLAFANTPEITGAYDASTGILTLTGVATAAQYQAALRSVTYENTSSEPSEAPRTVLFEVNDGDISFQTPTSYEARLLGGGAGAQPQSIATADFNGDGLLDLVVAHRGLTGANDSVGVLLNRGGGNFSAQVTYATGNQPTSVLPFDVDGDNDLDLVVTNFGSATVGVLYGNGNGTFGAQVLQAAGIAGYDTVAENFFEALPGDDVAVVERDTGQIQMMVPATGFLIPIMAGGDATADHFTVALATGDFNEDGHLDLLAVNQTDTATSFSTGNISLLLGDGAGNFGAPTILADGVNKPSDVVVADLNEDGDLDYVIANTQGGNVTVKLGNGNGTFDAAVTYFAGFGSSSVAVADFNGDGNLDIVVGNNVPFGGFAVLEGNGDGTFKPRVTFNSWNATNSNQAGPAALVVGDFDNDGQVDLASANQNSDTAAVLLNNTRQRDAVDAATINVTAVYEPTLANVDATVSYREGAGATALDTAPLIVLDDLDAPGAGDQIQSATVAITAGSLAPGDVLSADAGATGINVSYAGGVLTLSGNDTLADYEAVLRTVTFTADSQNPTSFGAHPTRTVEWTVTDIDGGSSTAAATTVNIVAPTHFNLLWHNTTTDELRDWTFTNGAVTNNSIIAPPVTAWQVAAIGNFNADGIADIVWHNDSTGDTRVWLMNASGQLASSIAQGSALPNWEVAATGDFNGDGMADIVWQNTANGAARVWLMENGVRTSQIAFSGPDATWFVTGVGDFNGDGTDDILWRNSVDGQLRDWTMANGTFIANTPFVGVSLDQKVAATGDFNNDGTDDIIFHNTTTGDITEWLMSNAAVGSTQSLGNLASDWKLSGAGDYNQDGADDLIWHNSSTGQVVEWVMAAGAQSSTVAIGGTPLDWQVSVSPATHADLLPLA